MGLGESDLLNEKGVGGDGGVASPMVPCSICLDAVMDGGDRATARLPCGHQFHLDCIGSAFNAKGVMQCPNCRKIEKGNWLYANGYRSFPDLGIDEWTHDEDLYDLNYSEMAYGVHWCPFSRLARVPSLFEDSESSPSIPYHDMLGHHAIFSEHLASSSGAHSCPYVAYFHPLQQPSSSGSQVSTESVIDGASFHHHWSSLSGPLEVQSSHTFPAVDLRYHNWDPHSSPGTRVGGAEQPSVASVTMRATGIDTDGLLSAGSILHPFLPGHGSASRASSSVVSSMAPPYHGSTRPQPRVHDIHVSHQHHTSPGIRGGPMFSGVQRSGGMRGLAPIGPTSSLPDHSGFYLFPPTGSSGRGSQDAAESIGGNRFYAWERDRFAPFPLMPVERDSAWWGMFPPATGGSDSRSQTGLRHRHGSERSSSQGRPDGSSYRPIHLPRMHPFI